MNISLGGLNYSTESIREKYCIGCVVFRLFIFGGWHDYVEALLDWGVYRVHCTPSVTHLHHRFTVAPKTLYPALECPSADKSQPHADNFGNILRRLEDVLDNVQEQTPLCTISSNWSIHRRERVLLAQN